MNAVAKVEPAQQQPLSTMVRGMEKQFALALPEHVSPERFVRVVVTAIQSNPDLQRANPDSVLGAALKCAQDGLLPDGREAALVVYNTKVKNPDTGRDEWVKKAQYLPMIAGVLAKVRRSGELLTISSHIVYEQDAFTYILGDDERIEHQPFMGGDRGKAIAAYAVAKTKDGGIYREVMTLGQIEQVRNVSRAKDSGPWKDWWDEMARKTVLRRLAKRLPMSTDLVEVFQRDDEHYDIAAADRAPAKPQLRRLHSGFDDPEPPEASGSPETAEVLEGEFTEAQGGSAAPDASGEAGEVQDDASGPPPPVALDPALEERVTAYLSTLRQAPSFAALTKMRERAKDLRDEVFKASPGRLDEIEHVFNELAAAKADEEKAKGARG